MSFFASLTQYPEDPILKLPQLFNADSKKVKVNLGIGSYKDDEGLSFLLPSVNQAEAIISKKEKNRDYLPIEGDSLLCKGSKLLVFGSEIIKTHGENIYTAQALGGTGACRIGGDFLFQETSKQIFIPNLTWANHKRLFTYSGMEVKEYNYYNAKTNLIDFSGLCDDVAQMPKRSTLLLHASCHNPTGLDLSKEQWHELSLLLKKHQIIPFFDMAYQGFSESIDDDAYPIRYFVSQGHELLVANSFSKTFGLYGERVGSLSVVTHNALATKKSQSQIKQLIRGNYSNPPRYGAALVAEILLEPDLKNQWIKDLYTMRDRLKNMREGLIFGLESKKNMKNLNSLKLQKGFFSFLGLNKTEVDRLIKEFSIYLPDDGRINLGGLNKHNIEYVIESISSILIS